MPPRKRKFEAIQAEMLERQAAAQERQLRVVEELVAALVRILDMLLGRNFVPLTPGGPGGPPGGPPPPPPGQRPPPVFRPGGASQPMT